MENKIKVVESNDIYTIYTFLKFKLNLQKSNSSCNPYIPVVVIWFCGIITFWLIIHLFTGLRLILPKSFMTDTPEAISSLTCHREEQNFPSFVFS